MKFEEEIIKNGFSGSLEKAIYHKKSKKLDVFLRFIKAVKFEEYEELLGHIKNMFSIPTFIYLTYVEENLTAEEWKTYLEVILKRLGSESARFQALDVKDCTIENQKFSFRIPYDASGVEELLEPLKKMFLEYGLHVDISLIRDEKVSVQAELESLQKEIEDTLAKQKTEAEAIVKINEQMKKEKRYKKNPLPTEVTPIKDIPNSANDISVYTNTNGFPIFMLEANTFGFEVKSFAKSKSSLATFKVTDETDSILVKKWLTDAEKKSMETKIETGTKLRIVGKAEYDSFTKQVVITASSIELLGKKEDNKIVDNAPIKRVELHTHTKMSNLDGVTEAQDYVKTAIQWGWKAMAFTDHNGIYSVPDIAHAVEKNPDFKPIYGVELNYIDDEKYFITLDERDIPLKDATYIVFDIETTGLSQTYDAIIEIAAHKVCQGGIIDTFETFVNPGYPIPEKIVGITHITDEMVKDALGIEEILPKFMEFCKGSILVAHNATFDVGMIYRDVKKYHFNYEMLPVIDTLNLFRAGYGTEVKTFNLKSLAKYFKVKQEQHHRATDDTRVTALCFIQMLSDLFKRNIYNYKDINSLLDPQEHWKHLIPSHITLLAQNPVGYKNMYKIISDALTKHFWGSAKALKSVINAHREGILIGSSCVNGNVFELALNRSIEEVKEEISFYDYIEVQPPTAYRHLFSDMPDGEERVQEIILKIIEAAKEQNKLVVATSDCHYLRPNLKKYRDILIASPQIGGGQHPLANYKETPDMHLRTTAEMLEEFAFLHQDLAYEIVVTNTNLIADQIEKFPAFKQEMFAPRDDEFKDTFLHIPSITEEVKRIVKENMVRLYGEKPHPIVQKRISRELNSIISNGYASVYYISHLMVKKSLSDGYLVGSRGSVGSSLVATMMNITEINPLSPHYRCKNCKFHTFKMRREELEEYGLSELEQPFQKDLQAVDSGYDLPEACCPVCGEQLTKDGHDIPFETFLGFDGDKVPDIDLNFSGEYQAQAHEYIRTVFGPENAFRAGTVGTIAEKNAYGYVKGYCDRKGITLRPCEIDRLASYLVGVKRSTGQHPGGIVVVPHYVDIYDVTPVQYPADNVDNAWRTTHYDYHSFENNLLKLDVLGHDDPTLIKYFMDYVHLHQEEFPFSDPQDIPIDDKNIYRLFSSTDVINVNEADIGSSVASYAVPEFGTNFVRQMLVETLPKTFAQLVKISGLSHGTDVWNTNAQDLVAGSTSFGKIEFKDIIGCRDDIMVDLLHYGLEPLSAFQIMEFVRKGKVAKDPDTWNKYKALMEEKHVPDWYIWSCERIKYMFPKAHATAYVLMALRIAWFKVYSPVLFYSAWFSKRAKGHIVSAYLGGKVAIRAAIEEISNKTDRTATDDDKLTALQVALEMTSRGIKFLPVDIMKSSATVFEVEDGALRIPFSAIDSLGESIAVDIVKKREEKIFTSKKDIQNRTRLSLSLFELFEEMNAFGNLPQEEPEEAIGLFAFV